MLALAQPCRFDLLMEGETMNKFALDIYSSDPIDDWGGPSGDDRRYPPPDDDEDRRPRS